METINVSQVLEWAEKKNPDEVVYGNGIVYAECVLANFGSDYFGFPVEVGTKTIYKGISDVKIGQLSDDLQSLLYMSVFEEGDTAGKVANILRERA